MNNNKRLRIIMAKHQLKQKDVSVLLSCSLDTVKHWTCKDYNPMPANLLELLELKLPSNRP